MIERFVDTSGWAEWADQTLRYHVQAVHLVEEVWNQGGRLVTTDLVLAELTALLTRPLRMPKPKQIQLLDGILSDPSVDVIPFESLLKQATWHLWRTRPDKDWSFVDCSSFVVMGQRSLTEALTSDRHFEQAGFVRLLK
jgi:predicted nucleic acid-binding protein